MSLRGRGINYDTGFAPAGQLSRPHFDLAQVAREIQVIANDLHCTAVRISGADCAERAEALRRTGAEVVVVTGCELSLFGAGFLPGETFAERIPNLGRTDLRAVRAELSDYLGKVAEAARDRFGGKITYAAGPWEDLDWTPFDIVSVDGYRSAGNRGHYAQELRDRFRPGKPLAITEFGCCGYVGAGDRGGLGWAIVDWQADPARLDGAYIRDEGEQVQYLHDLLRVFETEGVDSAFWFTFAGFGLPRRGDPAFDLDMASYGVVAIQDENGKDWRPKQVFHALAAAYGGTEV